MTMEEDMEMGMKMGMKELMSMKLRQREMDQRKGEVSGREVCGGDGGVAAAVTRAEHYLARVRIISRVSKKLYVLNSIRRA